MEIIESYELLEHYPFLKGSLPRTSLGEWPTPLEKLKGLSEELGCPAFIKRDDLSHRTYGGNKVRKLELILADVKRRGKKTIITIGGLGSHHILATAALARDMGMETIGLFFCQPVNDHVRSNLLLNKRFGAKMRFAKDYPGVAKELLIQSLLVFLRDFRLPYLLVPGGSTAFSTIGYINAVFELKKQLQEEKLPEPKAIFVPAGSGGTVAGLLAGIALAGMDTILYGVQVVPDPVLSPARVKGLAKGALRYLEKKGVNVTDAAEKISGKHFRLLKDYLGSGYGFSTTGASKAIETFNELDNIRLEGCYTGKAAAAFMDYCRRNAGPHARPVIFFNTYSSTHKYPQKEKFTEEAKELPQEFHWCFNEKPQNCSCGLKKANRHYCETGECKSIE